MMDTCRPRPPKQVFAWKELPRNPSQPSFARFRLRHGRWATVGSHDARTEVSICIASMACIPLTRTAPRAATPLRPWTGCSQGAER